MQRNLIALACGMLLAPFAAQGQEPGEAKAPAKSKSNVTISSIQGNGNSVIVSGQGPGSVKVFTKDQGKGNRVVVMQNGKVVVPAKMTPAEREAYAKAAAEELRRAEEEARRALQEADRLLRKLGIDDDD
jgi:hypothetical protein